jgi:hypothetical protein
MPIINGRRVTNIPEAGAYGRELLDELGVKGGRRGVFVKRGGNETIDPNKRYSKPEILGLKAMDIPDRTKGNLFAGKRSSLSHRTITEEVYDLSEKRFIDGLDFDEDDADWVVIPQYKLPRIWQGIAKFTPLMIMFPTDYPVIPPIGCYMRDSIPQSPNSHFYKQAYDGASNAPVSEKDWKWYCVYVQPGAWKPSTYRKSGDWRYGDNLWTYLALIDEALASNDE